MTALRTALALFSGGQDRAVYLAWAAPGKVDGFPGPLTEPPA